MTRRKDRKAIPAWMLMLLPAFGMMSCIDNAYDLDKDIDLSVSVGGNTLVVPIGDTEVITMDKLIEESDNLQLNEEGIYSIREEDVIDDVEIKVDAVKISVDHTTVDPILVDLNGKTDIEPFAIAEQRHSFLSEATPLRINEKDMPDINLGDTQEVVAAAGQPVDRHFRYSLNKEIKVSFQPSTFDNLKEINAVYFGEGNQMQAAQVEVRAAELGQLLQTGSQMSIESLQLDFPEGFVLALDNNYGGSVSVAGRTLKVSRKALQLNENLTIRFYVEKFIHHFDINHTDFSGQITYSIDFAVKGTFKPQSNQKANFYSGLNGPAFTFRQAEVVAKDIRSTVSPGQVDFKADITGLDDLKSVKTVRFKAGTHLRLTFDRTNLPLDFTTGSKFLLSLPRAVQINTAALPAGVAYRADSHSLSIDAQTFKGEGQAEMRIGINALDFTKESATGRPVVNGAIHMNEAMRYHAEATANGQTLQNTFVLKGGELMFAGHLLNFSRQTDFTCNYAGNSGNHVEVESANVIVKSVSSDINSHANIEIEEENIAKELKAIKQAYLANGQPTLLTIKVDFREMPSDIRKGLQFSDVKISLPQFILFADQPDIDENNVMTINDSFVPGPGNQYTYVKTARVLGIDLTRIDAYKEKGLVIGDDRKLVIPNEYTGISVEGTVKTTDGEEINSNGIADFNIYPTVEIAEMTVGKVVGTVAPDIEPVSETVELNLEDMDFLQNDETEILLQNPVINISLTNPVGVPVTLDMKLSGYKKGSNTSIEGAEVSASSTTHPGFRLNPARDGQPVTTNLLISRQPVDVAPGDGLTENVNVVIPNLSDLLKRLPDEVRFNINAAADQNADHTIDITPTSNVNGQAQAQFLITGNYDVTVPLTFETLHVNYTDTIDNLQADMEDVLDIATSAELELEAELVNTLPIDLHFKATAHDIAARPLNSIRATIYADGEEDGIIPGVSIEGQSTLTPVRIVFEAKDREELKQLDKVFLNLKAEANETKSGISLKASQSVQFKNISLRIKKVNLDLN